MSSFLPPVVCQVVGTFVFGRRGEFAWRLQDPRGSVMTAHDFRVSMTLVDKLRAVAERGTEAEQAAALAAIARIEGSAAA